MALLVSVRVVWKRLAIRRNDHYQWTITNQNWKGKNGNAYKAQLASACTLCVTRFECILAIIAYFVCCNAGGWAITALVGATSITWWWASGPRWRWRTQNNPNLLSMCSDIVWWCILTSAIILLFRCRTHRKQIYSLTAICTRCIFWTFHRSKHGARTQSHSHICHRNTITHTTCYRVLSGPLLFIIILCLILILLLLLLLLARRRLDFVRLHHTLHHRTHVFVLCTAGDLR